MTRFDVGVQLYPQHTTYGELERAWKTAEELGAASLWTWDHFFPITGGGEGAHLEGWTLLTAMAATTSTARLGVLVTSIAYRNPDLLADMARTADHVAGGRVVLGVGAGWARRDYEEYGYEFHEPPRRLEQLEDGVRRIKERIPALEPQPVGDLPVLIGGGGEQVTLRIVAEHADWWNTFGPVEDWTHKNRVLDEWCERVGRDPSDVVRTALVQSDDDVRRAEEFVEAGATHLIIGLPAPYDLDVLQRLLEVADG